MKATPTTASPRISTSVGRGHWRFDGNRWILNEHGDRVLKLAKDARAGDAIRAAAAPAMILALRNLTMVLAVTTEVNDVRVQAGIRRARAALAAAEKEAP